MNKFIILMLILLAWATSLSAQITRERADEIVLQHIENAVTPPYLLYVNVNTPSEAGIAITTSQKETFKAKYACWTYYLNENPELTGLSQHRYLFVKETDGNLLEVITSNDMVPDLTQWEEITVGLIDVAGNSGLFIYPNPTSGEFRVSSSEFKVENIEIFDVMGRTVGTNPCGRPPFGVASRYVASETRNYPPLAGAGGGFKPKTIINISHLEVGIYFLRIQTESGTITQKIIKN